MTRINGCQNSCGLSGRRLLIYILLVSFFVALVGSLWTVVQRHMVESSRRNVAIYVDVRDLAVLDAAMSGDSAFSLWSQVRALGVTGVVIPVSVTSQPPASSVAESPALEMVSPNVDAVRPWLEAAGQLGLSAVPLLLIPEDMESSKAVSDLVRVFSAVWQPPFVLFADGNGDPPGAFYPSHLLPQIADTLKTTGLKLGRVEFRTAPGENAAAAVMGNRIERVHTITPAEMHKYTEADAVQRYVRAVRERGYRTLWVRFNVPEEAVAGTSAQPGTGAQADASELLLWNLGLLNRLIDELRSAGFNLGQPTSISEWSNGWAGIAAAFLGAAAALAALLLLTGAPQMIAVLGFFGTILGGVVLTLGGKPILARQAAAFAAANGYAALSIILPFTLLYKHNVNGSDVTIPSASAEFRPGKSHRPGAFRFRVLRLFCLAVLIAFFGGLVITAALGDYRFMVRTEQYRGVKASFLLPLAWIGVFAFGWDPTFASLRWRTFWHNVKQLMQTAGVWWQRAALVGAALGVLAVYLARSANFVLPVPRFELALRAMLEETLVARPRAKEFLIGHPLLLLGFDRPAALRRFQRLLFVAGGVGAVSITNTFCHVHTPIMLSLLRTAYGFVLGGIGGLILVALRSLSDRLLHGSYGQGVKA